MIVTSGQKIAHLTVGSGLRLILSILAKIDGHTR
jgi:hypothetical protein